MMVESKPSSDDRDEMTMAGSDNEEPINEFKHSRMLETIRNIGGKKRLMASQRTEYAPVSEFSLGSRVKVQLNDLLGSLGKTVKLSDMRMKTKQASTKGIKTLPIPLETPEADKIGRVVVYENVCQEVSKWDRVVFQNRSAEQVVYPLNQPSLQMQTSREVVKRFKIKTPLEQEVAALLESRRPVVPDPTPSERKTLVTRLALHEAMEMRREMQIMRAKQSYKEAKARYQKKIKSKRYHRILKKERAKKEVKSFEALQKTNPELAQEKLDQLERQRIVERMTLRHRNTGKWAREQIIKFKNDKESGKAIQEQIALGRHLMAKQHVPTDSDDDGETEAITEESSEGHTLQLTQSDSTNPWINSGAIPKLVNNEKSLSEDDARKELLVGYRKFWEEDNKRRIVEAKRRAIDDIRTNEVKEDEHETAAQRSADKKSKKKVTWKESVEVENNMRSVSETSSDKKQTLDSFDKAEAVLNPVAKIEKRLKKDSGGKEMKLNTNSGAKESKLKKNSGVKKKHLEKNSGVQENNLKKDSDAKENRLKTDLKAIEKKSKKNSIANEKKSKKTSGIKEKKLKKISGIKEKKLKEDSTNKEKKLKEDSTNNEKKSAKKIKVEKVAYNDGEDSDEFDEVDRIFQDAAVKKAKLKSLNVIVKQKLLTKKKCEDNRSGVQNKKTRRGDDRSNASRELIDETLVRKRRLEDFEKKTGEDTVETEGTDYISVRGKAKTTVPAPTDVDEDVAVDPHNFITVKETSIQCPVSGEFDGYVDEEAMDDRNDDDHRQIQEEHRMTIAEAFADDDVVSEFRAEKQQTVEGDKLKDIDLTLPGWGEWGGKGLEISQKKKNRFIIKAPKGPPRKDRQLGHVIINEKSENSAKPLQVGTVPFPFRNAKDFEENLAAPIGKQWNPETAFRRLIAPKIVTKMGAIIEPIDTDLLKKFSAGNDVRNKTRGGQKRNHPYSRQAIKQSQ